MKRKICKRSHFWLLYLTLFLPCVSPQLAFHSFQLLQAVVTVPASSLQITPNYTNDLALLSLVAGADSH